MAKAKRAQVRRAREAQRQKRGWVPKLDAEGQAWFDTYRAANPLTHQAKTPEVTPTPVSTPTMIWREAIVDGRRRLVRVEEES